MTIAGRYMTLVMMVALCGCAVGQEASNTSAGNCEVKRSVSPDGTIVVQNRDCTVTKTPKKEIVKPPVGEPSASTNGPNLSPQDKTEQNHEAQVAKLRDLSPQPLPAGIDDPKLKAKFEAAMNGYFDYYIAGYEHRQRVFRWQLLSSKIIFVIVTFLVLSGMAFAAVQFREGMRERATALASAAAAAGAGASAISVRPVALPTAEVTKIAASAEKGIEVSSPVLGVIILVISLAFFYLYLVYVYPISELF